VLKFKRKFRRLKVNIADDRQPLCPGAVAVTYVEGLQNSPRRAASVTQYRLHCSVLRLYFAHLSQMHVAVRADEGIHRKGNATVKETADGGSP
jgi:hypothetical protein